jgi:hypothetical protein
MLGYPSSASHRGNGRAALHHRRATSPILQAKMRTSIIDESAAYLFNAAWVDADLTCGTPNHYSALCCSILSGFPENHMVTESSDCLARLP